MYLYLCFTLILKLILTLILIRALILTLVLILTLILKLVLTHLLSLFKTFYKMHVFGMGMVKIIKNFHLKSILSNYFFFVFQFLLLNFIYKKELITK